MFIVHGLHRSNNKFCYLFDFVDFIRNFGKKLKKNWNRIFWWFEIRCKFSKKLNRPEKCKFTTRTKEVVTLQGKPFSERCFIFIWYKISHIQFTLSKSMLWYGDGNTCNLSIIHKSIMKVLTKSKIVLVKLVQMEDIMPKWVRQISNICLKQLFMGGDPLN